MSFNTWLWNVVSCLAWAYSAWEWQQERYEKVDYGDPKEDNRIICNERHLGLWLGLVPFITDDPLFHLCWWSFEEWADCINFFASAQASCRHTTHFAIALEYCQACVGVSNSWPAHWEIYIPAEHKTDAKVPRPFPSACWWCDTPSAAVGKEVTRLGENRVLGTRLSLSYLHG